MCIWGTYSDFSCIADWINRKKTIIAKQEADTRSSKGLVLCDTLVHCLRLFLCGNMLHTKKKQAVTYSYNLKPEFINLRKCVKMTSVVIIPWRFWCLMINILVPYQNPYDEGFWYVFLSVGTILLNQWAVRL